MRTDITCALDGIGLQDLDEHIYVEDVTEETNVDQETAKRPGYGLLPLTDPGNESKSISVKLLVKQKNRIARMAIIQKVKGWASQGWFTSNMFPGLRIYVFCEQPPKVTVFEWTARLEIKFTAYGEAYWQDATPMTKASSSAVSSATVTIKPNGNRKCFLEADIAPSSGTLTSVTIVQGSQRLELTGLSVTSSAPLRIYYDELHILRIVSGSTSLLSKRSGDSSDDILLAPGVDNSISLTFSRACTYTLRARGLWQ